MTISNGQHYDPVQDDDTSSSDRAASFSRQPSVGFSDLSFFLRIIIACSIPFTAIGLLFSSTALLNRVSEPAPEAVMIPGSNISYRTVEFRPRPIYMERPNEKSDMAWEHLLPPGAATKTGFVYVDHPEKYNLRLGEDTDTGEYIYSVGVFHQLHCLSALRDNYWLLVDGVFMHEPESFANAKLGMSFIAKEHAAHCFEYLRQSIMCAGDMTHEWPRTDPDGRQTVDGWGIPRQCKSWTEIYDYAMAHNRNSTWTWEDY